MFRQVGIGAAAVLTVGMLAVGCSEDGDTIVQGGGGTDLNNTDQLNASSVASNNLAPDGGGLSPDNQNADLGQVRVVFACDASNSDGTFAGDNSAILLFRTVDNTGANPTNVIRVHASHYAGGVFTPPVELRASDRDERSDYDAATQTLLGVGATENQTATNINAAVCMYQGTAQYGGTTGNSTVANDVRANDGNWHIFWPGRSFFRDPRLDTSHALTNIRGPRRTLFHTVFVKGLRDQAQTTSTRVGTVSQTFNYGFQSTATEVPTAVGGRVAGTTTPGGVVAPGRDTPASDVTSFGVISDGLAGQASFGGTALPATGTGAVTVNTATAYTRAVPNTNGATFRSASYRVGEAVSFLGLIYTQVVNSMSGGGSVADSTGGSSHGGEDLKMFFASLNLATNTLETAAEVPTPNARNTGNLTAGTAFYPSFATYNQFAFVKYYDASLNSTLGTTFVDTLSLQDQLADQDWDQAETGANAGGQVASANPTFYEDISARFRVIDDGDGTCSISGTLEDNNLFGAAGDHDQLNPTVNTAARDTYPNNREMHNYNTDGSQFVFGADEGLVETVMFYTVAPNSGTGTINNIDRQLVAIGLNGDGTLVAGTNPVVISTHEVDFHDNTSGSTGNGNQTVAGGVASGAILRDPLVPAGTANGRAANAEGNGAVASFSTSQSVRFFTPVMNRTGEYVALAYLQHRGTSLNFRQSLMTVVYQTFRTTTGTTGGTVTAPNFNIRFSAPAEVANQTAADTDIVNRTFTAGDVSGAQTNDRWDNLPVNDFMFQGDLGYRCGLQSNKNVVNLLWEQSDSTEDRAFVRQVSVATGTAGTPTVTLGTVTGEIDGGAIAQNVPGALNFNNRTPSLNSTAPRNTFRFIDRDLSPLSGAMAACDLGADSDAQNVSAADGGLLIVYRKITDNTTSDNDHADAAVVALEWEGAAFSSADRVVISRSVNENAPAQFRGTTTAGFDGDSVSTGAVAGAFGTSSNSPADNTAAFGNAGFDASVIQLVCIGDSSDITANSGNNGATDHYILFTGPRADNFTSGTSLYTRKYEGSIRASATEAAAKPNIGDRLIPAAGTGPGTNGFVEPTRLDHLQGSNVSTVTVVESGTSVLVLFRQDNHIWAQSSSDGETWLTSGGAPNPILVDNDTTADAVGGPNVTVCDNGSCGVGDGILLFTKNDTDQDVRLRARGVVRP